MSGDWIKMRVDLHDDPRVIAISTRTGLDEFAVIGRLHRFWSWADKHSVDGNALSVTHEWLDRYVSATGFAEALVAAQWLDGKDGSLNLPEFERHNGESAKKRALTNKRVTNMRELKRGSNADSNATSNAVCVTKSLPEKRREEKNKEANSLCAEPASQSQAPVPLTLDTPKGSYKLPEPVICLETNTGAEWPVYPEMVSDWKTLFPAVDVLQQLRQMKAWLQSNKTKRKTDGGMKRFIVSWLSRMQDRGGAGQGGLVPRGPMPMPPPERGTLGPGEFT